MPAAAPAPAAMLQPHKADSRPIYAMSAPELLALPDVGTAKEFNMEGCIALEPDLVILPARLRDSADTIA